MSKAKQSAGILPGRVSDGRVEFLLVHPGGPFWARKDDGAWSIAKGEFEPGEDPLEAARREFTEETGWTAEGPFVPLTPVRQAGGKVVYAWLVRADFDPATLVSNTFELEWPPKSGKQRAFPEVDRAAWFGVEEASRKILSSQRPLLEEALALVGA